MSVRPFSLWTGLIVGCLLDVVSCAFAQGEVVEVRYLANEGFLLRSGEESVLIDALFGDGLAGYPVVPVEMRSDLVAGTPPFDGVDLVLVTHDHGDHFDPVAVRDFLTANPQAFFVSTPRAVKELARVGQDSSDRLKALAPAQGAMESVRVGGVVVKAFSLHHGRQNTTDNLGFVVEIAATKVLHVGDTEVDTSEIAAFDLPCAGIDLALLPPWALANQSLVQEGIGARRVGLMHVPARDAPPEYFGAAGTADGLVELLQGMHDDLIVFSGPGATVEVASKSGVSSSCSDR